MPPTCSDFPAHAFFSVDDVWCDACGQACSLAQVRVKSKANGTWQCNNCDLTYTQVHCLNGDPTAATSDCYAEAAGKGMQETKKLWEHHANKYRQKEEIYEDGGRFPSHRLLGEAGLPHQ